MTDTHRLRLSPTSRMTPGDLATPTEVAALLAASNREADAGHADAAIALAGTALHAAQQAKDHRACAEAVLCIACCELRLQGRFGLALETAQRAVSLFQKAQDVDGECRALATQAIAASRLGYYEMAVDSALLAVKLADAPRATRAAVMAYHALGIAMFSGKCYPEAGNAYQRAITLAQLCVPPLNAFELHSDLASTETFRYLTERSAGVLQPSLDMLEVHLRHCDALLADKTAEQPIAPASHTNNLLILSLTRTHLLTWQQRLPEAAEELTRLGLRQVQLQRPWLQAAVNWGHAELALARADLPAAARWAQAMADVASQHQHEGLLAVGLQLLTHVCERQGDTPGALAAMRQLALREQLARTQSLKGRLAVIERQVEMRHQAQQLHRLEHDSRLYQRLAMEDGLTGLANRRQFETSMAAALAGSTGTAAALCLAMIDIDRFKQINDQHSHNTGDAVLREIAALLKAHTRGGDLPARLAGDEFVILLLDADIGRAAQVCQRLQAAVAAHDWSGLSAGLQVRISVGLAAARAGDTLHSLMQRSDAQMYADKRR